MDGSSLDIIYKTTLNQTGLVRVRLWSYNNLDTTLNDDWIRTCLEVFLILFKLLHYLMSY